MTPTIFDMVSTVPVSSHPLFCWYHTNCIYEITSTIIHNIISIVYMTATVSVWSNPLVWWYHTLCMYDITPTICITSYSLYKGSHPHFMTSIHMLHDIICAVFMTSLPLYRTLRPLCVIKARVSIIPHQLSVWHHTLYYDITFSMHDITWALYDITPI